MLLAGKSLLIVEDDFLHGELLEDMAREYGCEAIQRAFFVDVALMIINAVKIDVALVDMDLGGKSSKPVIEALRLKSVPLVISTEHETDGLEKEWANIPVLQQPFQPSEFEAAVRSALARKLDH